MLGKTVACLAFYNIFHSRTKRIFWLCTKKRRSLSVLQKQTESLSYEGHCQFIYAKAYEHSLNIRFWQIESHWFSTTNRRCIGSNKEHLPRGIFTLRLNRNSRKILWAHLTGNHCSSLSLELIERDVIVGNNENRRKRRGWKRRGEDEKRNQRICRARFKGREGDANRRLCNLYTLSDSWIYFHAQVYFSVSSFVVPFLFLQMWPKFFPDNCVYTITAVKDRLFRN